MLTRESVGDLDIKVQFVIHQGVVAQQYIIKNSSPVPEKCEFNLELGFGARQSPAEFWWDDYQPPLVHSGISSTAGGCAAMLWAGDVRGQVQLDVVLFQDGRSVKLNLSNHGLGSLESAGDGVVQKQEFNDFNVKASSPYHLHSVEIGPGVTQELTALYSLGRYLTREQDQTVRPKSENEEDDGLGRKQAAPEVGASESHSIQFGSKHNEKVSVKGFTDDAVSTGLNETVKNRSKEIESAQEDSFWIYDGHELLDDTESDIRANSEEFSKLGAEVPNRHFLSPSLPYIDVSMFLKDNYHGNWTLESTTTSRLIRRHLQQLLFVNSMSIPGLNGLRSAIVFTEAHIISNDIPNWGSLSMFRFLLSMYAFLDRPEVVEPRLHDYLKRQIKYICERHLDWIFDVARPFQRGWAVGYNPNGSYPKFRDSYWPFGWFHGAVQFIKLCEFRIVFHEPDDQLFVLQKLQKRLGPWFECLEKLRDPKSDMWVSYLVDVPIDWLDPQYPQDKNVPFPAYLSADLIVLWKALKFVFELLDNANSTAPSLAKSSTPESTFSEVNHKLSALKASLPSNWRKTFSPSKLRTKIMDHFLYEHVQDPREPSAHLKEAAAQEGDFHGNKVIIEDSAKKVKDSTAKSVRDKKEIDPVRRKRVLAFRWAGNDKPRYLWYSWGSTIFEGIGSGFFKGESSLRVWKDTLEAQQVHQEHWWEKTPR